MTASSRATRPLHRDSRYELYGLVVRSALPLLGVAAGAKGEQVAIDIQETRASLAVRAQRIGRLDLPGPAWGRDAFRDFDTLRDGSRYLCYEGLAEFLVSPSGRFISGRRFRGVSRETFLVHLLGEVLSFALVQLGIEPFHATAVTVGEEAVAFLGNSGYGKSSLAAEFIRSGHRLLTDDLFILRETGHGFCALPGPARIKLFPRVADRLARPLTTFPYHGLTDKMVVLLGNEEMAKRPVPVRRLYVLAPRRAATSARITIRRLSARQACVALLRNVFNDAIDQPQRLEKLFDLATRLTLRVPVKLLSYPREPSDLRRLPAVREAILADLSSG